MRVGYGQTEASPGICLGERGEFQANFLGRPVGCDVRIDDRDQLCFTGSNAHRARFVDGQFVEYFDVPREVETGDRVSSLAGGYRFEGRLDNRLSLANGTYLNPQTHELAVVETVDAVRDAVLSMDEDGYVNCFVDVSVPLDENLKADVRDALSSITEYVESIRCLQDDSLDRNKKGEVQRSRPVDCSAP